MKKSDGFTLVELLVTLVVAAILLTVGVPSLRDFILNARTVSQANEFVSSIQLARSTAIKQQRNAEICASTTWNITPPTCTGGTNWSAGWVVWVDQDRDAVLDAGEVLRVSEPLDASSTFTSNAPALFRYAATGLVNTPGTMALCDSRTGETGRTITISPVGSISITNLGCT